MRAKLEERDTLHRDVLAVLAIDPAPSSSRRRVGRRRGDRRRRLVLPGRSEACEAVSSQWAGTEALGVRWQTEVGHGATYRAGRRWAQAAAGGARGRRRAARSFATEAGSVTTARTTSRPPHRAHTRRSVSKVRFSSVRQSMRALRGVELALDDALPVGDREDVGRDLFGLAARGERRGDDGVASLEWEDRASVTALRRRGRYAPHDVHCTCTKPSVKSPHARYF